MEDYLQYMKTLRTQMNGTLFFILCIWTASIPFISILNFAYVYISNYTKSMIVEVEDQAAKISVEEQMHITTIQNLEKDLDFGQFPFFVWLRI